MSITGSTSVHSLRSFESRQQSTHPMDSLSDVESSTKSMTIKDYYHASSTEEKQITYQHGMSNYSSLILGDDRISFNKSMTQCMQEYETNENFSESQSPQRNRYKSDSARRNEYAEAKAVCGGSAGIDSIEGIIQMKLDQRTKFGIFQLLKNFKYFDKHGTGTVDEYDFARALELMGFQFSHVQMLALFSRYDPELNGTVVYTDFVEVFRGIASRGYAQEKNDEEEKNYSKDDSKDGIDFYTSAKIHERQVAEIKKVFNVIDKEHRGYIEARDLDILLVALGHEVDEREVTDIIDQISLPDSNRIDVGSFIDWWTNRT